MSEGVWTLTETELRDVVRKAMAGGWDAAVAGMVYADGSKVEVAENANPYRDAVVTA